MCGYVDGVDATSSFLWSRRKGGATVPPRPVVDHTYANISGHYMYTHVNYEDRNKETALYTPTFQIQQTPTHPPSSNPSSSSSSTSSCLTFYVFFFENTDAELTVNAIGPSANQSQALVRVRNGVSDWSRVEAELPVWAERVSFVSHAQQRTDSGLGIDDVTLAPGRCAGML